MNEPFVIATVTAVEGAELLALYSSLGWRAYTDDADGLTRAVRNSTYVVEARADGRLIGLARGLSDDVSVFYLQDILVEPEWQRRGVGRALLDDCLQRFAHVRLKILLTDDEPAQHSFYKAMGYEDINDTRDPRLHSFVSGLES